MNRTTDRMKRWQAQTHAAVVQAASERGATMAEYGLLLALLALAASGILLFFGAELLELFTQAEDDFNTLPPPPPAD